jgi:outer membrane protein assembly factor BamB
VKLSFRTAIALLVLAPAALHADEWPMFGGNPSRNSISPDKNLPTNWDADKQKINVKWVANLGNQTFSTPVISGGRVFVGTNNGQPRDPGIKGDKGVLMCFSAADGKFLWQAVHDKLPGGIPVDAPDIGICSTPQVQGDFVYYVSNRNELVCRKAADGSVVWLLDMRKDLGALQDQAAVCSPLLVNGLVFVVTGNGRDSKEDKVLNPQAPSFIAVDAATGKIVWKDSSPGSNILTSQWGSAAYGVVDGQPQVVFPGGDGWLYAFEPATGKLLWKFNCKAHEKPDAKDSSDSKKVTLVATPVFAGDYVIASLGVDTETNMPGCLRAIDARKRGDVTKSAEHWKFEGNDFGVSIGSVSVHDGLVFAAEYAGFVNCIELGTGKRLWRNDLLAGLWGAPLIAGGRVYLRTGDAEVVLFEEGREAKLIRKIGTIPGMTPGNVVASDGVLYMATWTKLYAIAEGK